MKSPIKPPFALSRPNASRDSLRSARNAALVLLGLLLSGAALRLTANQQHAETLQRVTEDNLLRHVIVTRPKTGEPVRKLTLPATLRGYTETQIYARANGYLKAWLKTIGDPVKQGQLLAEVDVPELEHELAQGRATLRHAKSRLELARTTLQRWSQLAETDGAPLQEFEEKRAAFLQAEADVAAAEANVKRLEQIEGYRRIVAPFNGVITKRSVDVGALVNAGTQELFTLTQTDPLRLNVWIPQAYADQIKQGQSVTVKANTAQTTPLKARIERVAGALDPNTRSRQAEIVLDNTQAHLLPGSYVEIGIDVATLNPPLLVDANTLVTGKNGMHVVVVGEDHKITFRPVVLGHDFGRQVEIVDGIDADDLLVASPSDLLVQGETVGFVDTAIAEQTPGAQPKT